MQNPTPLFPSFHLPTLRRKPRSAQQQLTEKMEQLKQKSFSQLESKGRMKQVATKLDIEVLE